jgi:hypothetical protein
MHGRKEGGLADRRAGSTTYSHERDTSCGLIDAQPGTLGPYVTAGEHLSFALEVILNPQDGVIGGGGRC